MAATEEELRAQNEELLEANQIAEGERQRYQNLFDFAPDAYLTTDPAGIIQDANRTAVALLGFPKAELLGQPLAHFIAAEHRPAFEVTLSRLLRSGDREEWEAHLEPMKPQALDAALTVSVFGQGGFRVLRWIIREITERKQAEAAHRYLAAIVENSEDAILSKTLDGLITSWNGEPNGSTAIRARRPSASPSP